MRKWCQNENRELLEQQGVEIKKLIKERNAENRHFTLQEKHQIMQYIDQAKALQVTMNTLYDLTGINKKWYKKWMLQFKNYVEK